MSLLTIPLFPLNTVLMPRFPLALHIFEARYRQMISECVANDAPFGVALIRSGSEVGEAADPFDVGTLAAITELERLDDGRFNLVAVGTSRFRCVEILPPDPYISARVELLPDSPGNADAALREELLTMAAEYVRLLTGTPDAVTTDNLPNGADALSWILSYVLQIPGTEKQTLLEEDSAVERLARLRELYDRELTVVRAVLAHNEASTVRPVDTTRRRTDVSQN